MSGRDTGVGLIGVVRPFLGCVHRSLLVLHARGHHVGVVQKRVELVPVDVSYVHFEPTADV